MPVRKHMQKSSSTSNGSNHRLARMRLRCAANDCCVAMRVFDALKVEIDPEC